MSALDNPIWYSLTSEQANFALGTTHARRYPPQVAPFAAVCGARDGALENARSNIPRTTIHCNDQRSVSDGLARLMNPGEQVYLAGIAPEFDARWSVLEESRIVQMVWQPPSQIPADSPSFRERTEPVISEMTSIDQADMMALTTLVFPGYFRPRTPELGRYIGIRRRGRLAAMAGERMRLTGYQEISAVCTHPDYLGRGYAAHLIQVLIGHIRQRGMIPFLHVGEANTRARALYERLGFVDRCTLPLWRVLRRD